MHFISAIDSFKGSFSSEEANAVIKQVFEKYGHTVETIAIADGGEGTVDAFLSNNSAGEKIYTTVPNLTGEASQVYFGWLPANRLAVVEAASASGFQFIDQSAQTHPSKTSSYGTGCLIKAALDQGAETIVVGLGGTGTIDGGMGLLKALGVTFYDQTGNLLPAQGSSLKQVASYSLTELDERIQNVTFLIAVDVLNPLTGPDGAVRVFGQQKGLQPTEFATYDRNLKHYAELFNDNEMPGDGTAGGMGFALRVCLGGQICSGFGWVSGQADFYQRLANTDVVITGEGRIDQQSLRGKVPIGVAESAKLYGRPVIAFTGSSQGDPLEFDEEGIDVIIPIVDAITTLPEALEQGLANLERAAERVICLLDIQDAYYS